MYNTRVTSKEYFTCYGEPVETIPQKEREDTPHDTVGLSDRLGIEMMQMALYNEISEVQMTLWNCVT